MNSIFSYESKFTQMLLQLADLFIMNVLFVLCCIPLFTIGAAQSALYSGIRQMLNKEDDSSCIKAFFKGFASGFGKITLLHTLLLMLIAVLIWITGIAAILSENGFSTWLCGLAVCLVVLFHSMLAPFHSNFDCTPWQLLRNVFFTVMAYPIRALGVAILTWIPFIVLLLDLYIFLQGFPIWALLYYSVAFLFSHSIMKAPFTELREDFLEAHNEASTEEPV